MQEGDGKNRDVHVLRASLGITEYTHKFTKWMVLAFPDKEY